MTNIYAKDVSNIKVLDPYRLQELYQMHPCAEHVVKKLLVAGGREGGKNLDTDISDCIRTLTRWQAMRAEDAASATVSPGIDATHSESVGREFVSRYDWKGIPDKYKWAVTSANGMIYAYEKTPTIRSENSLAWTGEGRLIANLGKIIPEWQDSLEARPQ